MENSDDWFEDADNWNYYDDEEDDIDDPTWGKIREIDEEDEDEIENKEE